VATFHAETDLEKQISDALKQSKMDDASLHDTSGFFVFVFFFCL
jgi:hypothetical protein